ncbi:MAG: hypothetical protein HQL12_03280 [Candidatus Omnitrophica bacterium]|nr:hypothetical protein [Candidatus Omnitrophota bacterium]
MKTIGFWAAVILPLWDIPLMLRVVQRKSSQDISMVWAVGIWTTAVLMAPSAFISGDKISIGFNIMNVIMLTGVLIVVIIYRKGKV